MRRRTRGMIPWPRALFVGLAALLLTCAAPAWAAIGIDPNANAVVHFTTSGNTTSVNLPAMTTRRLMPTARSPRTPIAAMS